jgi:hypothetical protein
VASRPICKPTPLGRPGTRFPADAAMFAIGASRTHAGGRTCSKGSRAIPFSTAPGIQRGSAGRISASASRRRTYASSQLCRCSPNSSSVLPASRQRTDRVMQSLWPASGAPHRHHKCPWIPRPMGSPRPTVRWFRRSERCFPASPCSFHRPAARLRRVSISFHRASHSFRSTADSLSSAPGSTKLARSGSPRHTPTRRTGSRVVTGSRSSAWLQAARSARNHCRTCCRQ